jgi:hypothetical protein
LLLPAIACKQTYEPPAISHPPSDLVVEGWIETNGSDSTVFTLSRTVKLDSNAYTPESGATVVLEDSLQNSYPLHETQPGSYTYPAFAFNNNTSYRLHITTGGKEYASAYVPLVSSPPIDSVNFVRQQTELNNGVQIYASSHDPLNKTRYYRWQYQETWEFHSAVEATVQFDQNTRSIFTIMPGIGYVCWHNQNSTDIVLASTTQLSSDLAYEVPIIFIPDGSQKLTVRYSIFVKQYGLTKDAFTWWQILQKNTEQIGSIFGVQPSANPGNIRCLTDTSELVLGFVSGGNSQTQRIFITNDQIKPWEYKTDCVDATCSPSAFYNYWDQGFLPWLQETPSGLVHYEYKTCVDCRLTGTDIRPSFW